MATSCEELSHWKRLWCWEGLGAGEGDNRGWDGWMASLTRWTWVWVNSRSWWWTGRPSMLRFMGSQRVGHDWATELNWAEPTTSYLQVPTWQGKEIHLQRGTGNGRTTETNSPWLFIGWVLARKEEESLFFLLGSTMVIGHESFPFWSADY